MPLLVAHLIPFAEGAVVTLAAFAFGRWRFRHPRDRLVRWIWVGGMVAAVLAGIDAWNWLPGWPHHFPLSPSGVGPLPTPLHVAVLLQGFLLPPWWLYLGPGHVVPDWAAGPPLWLGQAYLSLGVAAILSLAYILGARQTARLRRVLPFAAGWGAAIVLLRMPALLYSGWLRIHHLNTCQGFCAVFIQPFIGRLAGWVIAPQIIVALLALPALALLSAGFGERQGARAQR